MIFDLYLYPLLLKTLLAHFERCNFLVEFEFYRDGKVQKTKYLVSGYHRVGRTVIAQREDGIVLFLVTDIGKINTIAPSLDEIVDKLLEYGAVNAANIDGGSSSSMYYDGKYEMTSVTLGLKNASWRLPTAFIIESR